MKTEVAIENFTPHKRSFYAIMADYDLNRSICELIDNCIDNWTKLNKAKTILVDIQLILEQQLIIVKDNSGGVAKEDLTKLISLGGTSNNSDEKVIGLFGVGTKRAVVALAEQIKIITRKNSNKTYLVEFDDQWIENESWELPIYETDNIDEETTIIELTKLRNSLTEENINKAKKHLSETYSKLLSNKKLNISLNGEQVIGQDFENWVFVEKYEPTEYETYIPDFTTKSDIKIMITTGLIKEPKPSEGEYGVYFYCNERLIAKNVKSDEVGFISGLAGLPHPSSSLARVIVSISGPAMCMPWNSSKSGINYNHPTFIALKHHLIDIVKYQVKASRIHQGLWSEISSKATVGQIKRNILGALPGIKKIKTPFIPKIKREQHDPVKNNSSIIEEKPWLRGIVEVFSIIEEIKKKKFETKNRAILILLDSNLEISFKEYITKGQTEKDIKDQQLKEIMLSRERLCKMMIELRIITKPECAKIIFWHDLRNKLLHERTSSEILTKDLDSMEKLLKELLERMFNLNL